MTLLEQVRDICTRLAPHGWGDVMAEHGLDLTSTDLAGELAKPLSAINRSLPGFEDFALEGQRGIEPGDPARSLLFHALASPFVVSAPDGRELGGFPTAAELDAVENYVYGVNVPSLSTLLALAGRRNVAVVAFAVQYRPAPQTPHRRHADVCVARTGVARVGTAGMHYDPKMRGYLPTGDDAFQMRVLPARYAVYLAVLVPGDQATSVPMRFLEAQGDETGDQARQFWIPVHKLFSGTECIRGHDLHVRLRIGHLNEKLRRIHLALGQEATWREPEISTPPFRFTEGIAELSDDADAAPGTVVPVPHPRIVEPAVFRDAPLTFRVPPNTPLSSSFRIAAEGRGQHAPEYVHVRTMVTDAGEEIDLNDRPDVEAVVSAGGYQARHYLDFTGDGWITPVVPELAVAVPRKRSAYSVIAAPDFFPGTDQRSLSEWAATRLPSEMARSVWRIPPDPLSDERFPANLQLPGRRFRSDDDTVTAIVSPRRLTLGEPTNPVGGETARHSHLPDDAAGVFAPGWDVSVDGGRGIPEHLVTYGLGSPFPEDAKLCAALSSFWPAVAPDATRTFAPAPSWPTVIPLTDDEIGIGDGLAWDGVSGPVVVEEEGQRMAEYTSFAHADYVLNALGNRFTLAHTAAVGNLDYQARILAMLRVYESLGVDLSGSFSEVVRSKARWTVLSFSAVDASAPEVTQAQEEAGADLQGTVHRFEVFLGGAPRVHPTAVDKVRVPMLRSVGFLTDPVTVLRQEGTDPWQIAD